MKTNGDERYRRLLERSLITGRKRRDFGWLWLLLLCLGLAVGSFGLFVSVAFAISLGWQLAAQALGAM